MVPGQLGGCAAESAGGLWPLITVTRERRRQRLIYISKPYLQHDYNLLVRADSAYFQVQDMASASISFLGTSIGQQFLKRLMPRGRMVTAASEKEVVENVCGGRTDAAFLNEFSAGAVFLSGISCTSQPLRVIPLPMLRTKLGVGSTLEAKPVADEIRRGIDDAVLKGDLANILKSGGYFSTHNMLYFTALLEAQRRERWLVIAVGSFAFLLALTVFAADRIRRQRNRIKVTEGALRYSEGRFRELLEGVTLVAVITDVNGNITFCNEYTIALTRWSKEELIGCPAKEFLEPAYPLQVTNEAPCRDE